MLKDKIRNITFFVKFQSFQSEFSETDITDGSIILEEKAIGILIFKKLIIIK